MQALRSLVYTSLFIAVTAVFGVVVLVSAVLAYLSGIEAVRRLGSSIASFVALSEVILAVIFAALLLGQIPTPIQLVGGVLIVTGIVVVQAPLPRHRDN